MAEVFTRTATQLAGVFSADQGRLSFGAGVSTALVQNVNATYAQNITRLYEVGNIGGKANVYYVGGRSQGTLAIARVIGPSVLMSAYYTKFGDVCQAKSNTLEFTLEQLDCSDEEGALLAFLGEGDSATYSARFCVITQIGISVAAQDMIVNESSQLMFSGLDYEGP